MLLVNDLFINNLTVGGPNTCSSNDPVIRFGSYGRIGKSFVVTGYAQICDKQNYIPICRDGISNESLHFICAQYPGFYSK